MTRTYQDHMAENGDKKTNIRWLNPLTPKISGG
jgi:hypothetical protein